FPGKPPPPPPFTTVEVRYAKLAGNPQLFEIRPDKLRDIVVSAKELRDPQLARFKTDDVRRLSIQNGKTEVAFVKEKKDDKDEWRMLKPEPGGVEEREISEVLDKLSGLQARDANIIDADKKAPSEYGLDQPTVVSLVVEERDDDARKEGDDKAEIKRKKADAKPPTIKHITFRIGGREADKGKLYVQVDNWPRINVLESGDKGKPHALWNVVSRPALAYRPRKVLDVATADLSRIEIERGKDTFALAHEKDKWRLAQPVTADADDARANDLAGTLGRLDAAEFITDAPKKEDLDKLYGLEKPAATVNLTFTDAKKLTRILRIGKESPEKK